MSYYRFIDKGEGPTKLFVGGVHGAESETTIDFFKSLPFTDFSRGKTFIYNFDTTPYISTLKKEYYDSKIGKYIVNLIKKHKPDFYTELHCYNIKNYKKLISQNRRESQGVPPLIELEDNVLISSVSPLIRMKYFSKGTVCKTLEIPCFSKNNFNERSNESVGVNTYLNVLKLIAKSTNRKDFESKMIYLYPKQVELAIKYSNEIFGKGFPPF